MEIKIIAIKIAGIPWVCVSVCIMMVAGVPKEDEKWLRSHFLIHHLGHKLPSARLKVYITSFSSLIIIFYLVYFTCKLIFVICLTLGISQYLLFLDYFAHSEYLII